LQKRGKTVRITRLLIESFQNDMSTGITWIGIMEKGLKGDATDNTVCYGTGI